MFKLDLEKAKELEIKLPTPAGSSKKQGNFRKTSASLIMPKTLLCGSQQILRDGNFRSPLLPPEKPGAGQEATVRTRHGSRTGSKLGKEYDKAVYRHLAYLIYMQSTSSKMPDWMKPKLKFRLSMTSDTQMIPLLWKRVKRN